MNCIFLINSPRMRNKLVVFKQIAVLPPHLSIVLNLPVERVIKITCHAANFVVILMSGKTSDGTTSLHVCCTAWRAPAPSSPGGSRWSGPATGLPSPSPPATAPFGPVTVDQGNLLQQTELQLGEGAAGALHCQHVAQHQELCLAAAAASVTTYSIFITSYISSSAPHTDWDVKTFWTSCILLFFIFMFLIFEIFI